MSIEMLALADALQAHGEQVARSVPPIEEWDQWTEEQQQLVATWWNLLAAFRRADEERLELRKALTQAIAEREVLERKYV